MVMRNFTEHVVQAFLRHTVEVEVRGSQNVTCSFISIEVERKDRLALQQRIAVSLVVSCMLFAAKQMQLFDIQTEHTND